MCVPYLIPDPPPKMRIKSTPQGSEKSSLSEPSEPLRPQPAFIEISPRLTYVASPKAAPRRSNMPPRRRPAGGQRLRSSPQHKRHAEGAVAGKQVFEEGPGSSKEGKGEVVGIGIDIEKKECPTGPPQQPKALKKPPSPIPPPAPSPPPKKTPPPTEAQRSPKSPASSATSPPQKKEQPSPPPQAPQPPRPPLPQPTRPTQTYTHRPPSHHHHHNHHHPRPHSRSSSNGSSISQRSFIRMKRNLGIVWERLKELEKWKHDREVEDAERGRRRVGWEFGLSGVRNQSRMREREQRERSVVRERMMNEREQEIRWQKRRDEEGERERQRIRDEDARKERERQRVEDSQRQRGVDLRSAREQNQHFGTGDRREWERPTEIRREKTQIRLGERWG